MSRYAHEHPEQFEPGGVGFEPLFDRADYLRMQQKEGAAQASTRTPTGDEDAGSTPAPSTELPDDATTWRGRCVACGDPTPPGRRWCSRSCYRAENLDYEMEG